LAKVASGSGEFFDFQRVFMIRPWIGVLSVVLGLAALPCSAMAQEPDTAGPQIAIAAPAQDAQYTVGETVAVSYSCVDPSGVADCAGTTASGGMLDTSQAGAFVFRVTAHDQAGNESAATASYSVVAADDGDVGGEAPATLAMNLGTPAAFAPFTPGVALDYTTSLVATLLSTAADATLTVADPSATDTGHLVNGTWSVPQPLRAAGATDNQYGHGSGSAAAVGGSASPTTLVTYDGPVANDPVTVTFTQVIGETDALRTGSYAKTLTFTLSTTNP
jgi:hypothetical protein